MFKTVKCLFCSALILLSACSDKDENKKSAESANNLYELKITAPDSSERVTYNVEIADTFQKVTNGLKGRISLKADSGMLLDINTVNRSADIALWMKDTLIPLDMIFIDENGEIFYFHENAVPNTETQIVPPKRPRAVLEVNAGQIAEKNIKIGDTVKNDLLGNLNQ